MKNLIVMTQSRLAKGVTRASESRKEPLMMNAERLAVVKIVPEFDEVEEAEERHHERGCRNIAKGLRVVKVTDGEHLCRGLVALGVELAGFHRGRKGLGGLPGHPWPVRHF